MITQDKQQKIKHKIDKLSVKLDELKQKAKNIDTDDELNRVIKEAQSIRDSIIDNYETELKSQDQDWDTFDKNIYNSIESFDKAFERAGAIFTTKE